MNRALKTLAQVAVLLPLLAGCGTVAYVPPTTGAVATIDFVNDAQRNLNIAFFDRSTGCEGRRKVPVVLPTTAASFRVAGERDLTFQYYLTNFGNAGPTENFCLMNLRFLPRAGHRYVFRTVENVSSCRWLAVDATDPRHQTVVELERIPWKSGFSEDSSFCDK